MRRIFSSLFLFLILAVGSALAIVQTNSVSAATVSASPTYYVNLTSNGFEPNSLIIARNSTVVFTNSDTVSHSVTSTNAAGAGPNSSAIPPGQTYTFAFQRLGPFSLVDSLNKSATATVTVVAEGDPSITTPNVPSNSTKGTPTQSTATTSANGPVAAGEETSVMAYVPAFVLGGICLGGAAVLLFVRYKRSTSGN